MCARHVTWAQRMAPFWPLLSPALLRAASRVHFCMAQLRNAPRSVLYPLLCSSAVCMCNGLHGHFCGEAVDGWKLRHWIFALVSTIKFCQWPCGQMIVDRFRGEGGGHQGLAFVVLPVVCLSSSVATLYVGCFVRLVRSTVGGKL